MASQQGVYHRFDPVDLVGPQALEAMLEFAQTWLAEMLVAHARRDAGCTSMEPAELIRVLRAPFCAESLPGDDIRAVVRFAQKPTRFLEGRFRSEANYWLDVTELVITACPTHSANPERILDGLAAGS